MNANLSNPNRIHIWMLSSDAYQLQSWQCVTLYNAAPAHALFAEDNPGRKNVSVRAWQWVGTAGSAFQMMALTPREGAQERQKRGCHLQWNE